MSDPTPRPLGVSVIIPCRNDAATIRAAVTSVVAQQWPATELLLCDDASSDASVALAQEAATGHSHIVFRVIPCGGRGAAAARNAGLTAATGDVVAFLDSDDTWLPGKLSACLREFADGADVVAHAEFWSGEDGRRRVDYGAMVDARLPFALSVLRLNPFSTSAVCIRKALIDQIGPFDEHLPSAEDYDFWLRLALLSPLDVRFLGDVLGVYTLRSGSESSRIDARHAAMLTIGDRYLPRIAPLATFPPFERLRYRSRVRLASGIRYLAGGRRGRGVVLIMAGLLQWPWRPEIIQYVRARLRSRPDARTD